jgi:hypothetical protein
MPSTQEGLTCRHFAPGPWGLSSQKSRGINGYIPSCALLGRIPGRIENFSSIAAKSSHWVDAGCSARRNVSGKKSDGGQKQNHSRECRWIGRFGSE